MCSRLTLLLVLTATLHAQDVPIEYRVKAAFLYNFIRFVEWPAESQSGPLIICVAGRNPLGSVLEDAIRGETVGGRPIEARLILEPEPGCHVTFIPEGAAASAYLRAARAAPTLTVGETGSFIADGGIIRFFLDDGKVRFEINPQAADRAQLRISSRLLQLARIQHIPGDRP
jgi:hypothetical protein